MKRVLLISLSLVLALVGWSAVGAADDGFYVIPAMRGNSAPVPKTGQTASYAAGDDGDLEKGIASPPSRYTNNGNGTVTDKLTGLIWMTNPGVFTTMVPWDQAMSAAAKLASGSPGLTDGSKAGDWRLPNLRELQSLVDYSRFNPAFSGVPPFTGVQWSYYWSSTTYEPSQGIRAWCVSFYDGSTGTIPKGGAADVWCVRDAR